MSIVVWRVGRFAACLPCNARDVWNRPGYSYDFKNMVKGLR